MSADFVWVSGGDQAKTFHDVPNDGRRTVCGRMVGVVIAGKPSHGVLVARAEARGKECRTCYGHAQVRKPIVGDRRNA